MNDRGPNREGRAAPSILEGNARPTMADRAFDTEAGSAWSLAPASINGKLEPSR
jgi:hypothetical protein